MSRILPQRREALCGWAFEEWVGLRETLARDEHVRELLPRRQVRTARDVEKGRPSFGGQGERGVEKGFELLPTRGGE